MRPKRILLMYISPNSGHHRASLALEKALHELSPDSSVLSINTLSYTNPILERIIKKTYFGLIRTHPEVWGYLYDNPSVVKSTQSFRNLVHRFNSPKLQLLLEEFKPDVVACTQAFPCGLIAEVKKNLGLAVPLVGVLTDYFPHSYWIYDNVDFYIVSSERAKMKLSQNGIKPEKILTHGIPIDPKFRRDGKKENLTLRLGLDPKIPTLLLMGGSQGLGPIAKIVKVLDRLEVPIQILVVCGSHKRLYRHLKKRERHFRKRIKIFDFVENADELMEVSTLLITKPGGLTTAEGLAKQLPLVIFDPIRGQETSNANFLVEEGLAVKARDEEEVVVLVRELLHHPAKLEEMRLRIDRYRKPTSALDAAYFLLSLE
ncbi:MAG: hypothetical protein HY590_06185 [Candidatus Omnitrophica bacterium]|nr:hypothetical protein [Candidatus Omnitrophota bacterium]